MLRCFYSVALDITISRRTTLRSIKSDHSDFYLFSIIIFNCDSVSVNDLY
nr:MAG TPA: hypothetical protein [Caudoviricetes sp.]DAU00958.1 MAG TPA: hypothetical protein [Caudoviricetes sp.]